MITESQHNPLLTLKMAVLADGQLLTHDYQHQHSGHVNSSAVELFSLETLLDTAHAFDLDTVWMCPGSTFSRLGKDMLAASRTNPSMKIVESAGKDGTPHFLQVWRTEGSWEQRKSVKFAFPEWDSRWPWQSCTDAATLLNSVRLLQETINWEVFWGPGRVGQQLMLWQNNKRPEWIAPAHVPDVVKQHLAVDMLWKRPLTDEEKQPGMWFHLFDGNSKYLAACTGVQIGEGAPEYIIEDSAAGLTFKAYVPAVWNVDQWGWIWTPELEYRLKQWEDTGGLRPIIHEAYIWPKFHQALRSWGKDLWIARMKLKQSDPFLPENHPENVALALAYQGIKSIYTQAMGKLARNKPDNTLYRPDIWSMIVSTAKRNMGFRARKLAKAGYPPCFWKADALGLVSEGESIVPLIPIILDRNGQLGGFKHAGSARLTPELAATFEDTVPFQKCYEAISKALEG